MTKVIVAGPYKSGLQKVIDKADKVLITGVAKKLGMSVPKAISVLGRELSFSLGAISYIFLDPITLQDPLFGEDGKWYWPDETLVFPEALCEQ